MISYLNKDITTVEKGIVAHGVNAQKKMNSGVAKAIKEKWPIVYNKYMDAPGGKQMLGRVVMVRVNEELFVANCYTQEFYGNDEKKYADSVLIHDSLSVVYNTAKNLGLDVYMPRIGCKRGGLDWVYDVEPTIILFDRIFKNVNTIICDYEEEK